MSLREFGTENSLIWPGETSERVAVKRVTKKVERAETANKKKQTMEETTKQNTIKKCFSQRTDKKTSPKTGSWI